MMEKIDALRSMVKGLKDDGPAWVPQRKYTTSADMTTAAAITGKPEQNKKIVADDIIVSNGGSAAILFDIEMEDSANVLTAQRIPINGSVIWTLRDGIKGDAANKRLYGKASAAGAVYITVCYHSEE